MDYALPSVVALLAVISVLISPKVQGAASFFSGRSPTGQLPTLLTLTFSQVTTWVFARSLMNAAILGYYYGIWGTLAYAAYYLSFLSGAKIIDHLRFELGYESVQGFLQDRFGRAGTLCYNFVVALRLVSEVFANLLVIGILFGASGSNAYILAILGFSAVTLLYSLLGGLYASLKTDLLQFCVFICVLVALLAMALSSEAIELSQLMFKPFVFDEPGPILMAVAFLQIWSYPMHDPVMMDRGFIADRKTTRASFYHAAWISILCIGLFGALGVFAGANALEGEGMTTVLERILGSQAMLLFNITLVISAMSTLDSTLSSSAKLVAVDMGLIKPSVKHGRWVMVLFLLAGLGMLFLGSKDLFSAVAVSGTASMYLLPVIFFSLWGGCKNIPVWSYVASFCIALVGAALYFSEAAGYSQLFNEFFAVEHKYSKLFFISLAILGLSCLSFVLGMGLTRRKALRLCGE